MIEARFKTSRGTLFLTLNKEGEVTCRMMGLSASMDKEEALLLANAILELLGKEQGACQMSRQKK